MKNKKIKNIVHNVFLSFLLIVYSPVILFFLLISFFSGVFSWLFNDKNLKDSIIEEFVSELEGEVLR